MLLTQLIDIFKNNLDDTGNIDKCIKKMTDNIDELINTIENILIDNKNVNLPNKDIKQTLKEYPTDNNKLQLIYSMLYNICLKLNYMTLECENEFKKNKNFSYNITFCDTDQKTELFTLYLLQYFIESTIYRVLGKNRCYVGIDCEFNNQKISLMQICFELDDSGYIWIIDPKRLSLRQKQLLTKYLMINDNIIKILHGAESLDIPFIYNELLENKDVYINAFTDKYIDTRFLCEYFRISVNDNPKCSIYYALKYFDVITDEKFNHLNEIHDSMGPIQDITWQIDKLSSFHKKYAFYDVLYLKQLVKNIYSRAYNETPQYYKFYDYVSILTRFVLKERKNKTNIIDNIKHQVDPLNNFMIKHNNENIRFIDIYLNTIDNLKNSNVDLDLDILIQISYFKMHITYILKKVIYHIITENYTVYIKKNTVFDKKLMMEELYNNLKKYKYNTLMVLIKIIQSECNKKIKLLYS